MKTPDEIKKGLAAAAIDCRECRDCNKPCAYHNECSNWDYEITSIPCVMVEDALAYIQQLEAQVPKWINVEQRLPDEGKKVIVWHPAGTVKISTFRFGRWWDHHGYHMGFRVVYWMPLPELPKEDEDE